MSSVIVWHHQSFGQNSTSYSIIQHQPTSFDIIWYHPTSSYKIRHHLKSSDNLTSNIVWQNACVWWCRICRMSVSALRWVLKWINRKENIVRMRIITLSSKQNITNDLQQKMLPVQFHIMVTFEHRLVQQNIHRYVFCGNHTSPSIPGNNGRFVYRCCDYLINENISLPILQRQELLQAVWNIASQLESSI